jgi:hypothetical protein
MGPTVTIIELDLSRVSFQNPNEFYPLSTISLISKDLSQMELDFPVPIDVTPSQHYHTPPPSSAHHVKASRTNASLGGGAPTPVAAAGAVPRAGAPPEATPAAVAKCLSHLHVVGLPLTVFSAGSE